MVLLVRDARKDANCSEVLDDLLKRLFSVRVHVNSKHPWRAAQACDSYMNEMPVSEAREHLAEVIDGARQTGESQVQVLYRPHTMRAQSRP